jgi:hypothetical protein
MLKKVAATLALLAVSLSLLGLGLLAFAFSHSLQSGRWITNPRGIWGHLLEIVFVLLVVGFVLAACRMWRMLFRFLSQ